MSYQEDLVGLRASQLCGVPLNTYIVIDRIFGCDWERACNFLFQLVESLESQSYLKIFFTEDGLERKGEIERLLPNTDILDSVGWDLPINTKKMNKKRWWRKHKPSDNLYLFFSSSYEETPFQNLTEFDAVLTVSYLSWQDTTVKISKGKYVDHFHVSYYDQEAIPRGLSDWLGGSEND